MTPFIQVPRETLEAAVDAIERVGWSRTCIASELRALLNAPAVEPHTDHPMRHWDKTCPACEVEPQVQEPDYKALYEDLLYCVGKKYPGESRHDTAKRYLLDRDNFGIGEKSKETK